MALTVTGAVLTSLSLPILPFVLLIIGETLLLPISIIAITGVCMMVGGYVAGESALSPVREEHSRLLRERSRFKKELRLLKEQRDTRPAPLAARPAFHVTLVSLAF